MQAGGGATLEAAGLRMVWLPLAEAAHVARLGQALSLHPRVRFVVVCEVGWDQRHTGCRHLGGATHGTLAA